MNQITSRSKALTYIVIIIAILSFLCIWPLNLIHASHTLTSNEEIARESDAINVEHNITQMFVGQEGELSAVELYVCNEMQSETITFRLYDSSYTELFNTFYVVNNNQKTPGFVHIPVRFDLEKDQEYFYTIEGLTSDLYVALEDHETSTSIVNGYMSYAGEEITGYNVIIRYEYSTPFIWWQSILFLVIIAALTTGIIFLIHKFLKGTAFDKEVKVQKVFQYTLNPIIAVGTFISLLAVFPGRKFGSGVVNYLCWGTGVLLFSLLLFYLVNYKRTYTRPLLTWDYVKTHYTNWLQVIAIAAAIWYCFEYMNGLYDIHHAYATRKLLVAFFFILITTYRKKEVFNVYNLIWLIGSSIFGFFYAKPYFGVEEQDELYKLSALVIVVGGLVIINMIISIISLLRKKCSIDKINLWFAIPFIIFSIAIIALKNTRQWPILLVVLCFVLIFRLAFWDKREQFMMNLCNGILLNFIFMMIFSLMHRPYYYYIYHRYNMSYYTVTMTATHLTLSIGAALIKLFAKIKTVESKKELIPEMALLGMISCYQIFTLSRTGYLATGVMILFSLVVVAVLFDKKKRVNLFFRRVGLMLVSVLFMFPITFTATRILPAVCNDPVIYDFEPCIVTMYKGTPTDCEYYMDIERFIAVFRSKVLGVGEDVTGKNFYIQPLEATYLASNSNENIYEVVGEGFELASAQEEIEELEERNEDVTNGRMDIYASYINAWNLWGHDDMGTPLQDNSMATHAHSIYFQIIHDHGLIFGIYFVIFMGITLILSIKRVKETSLNYYQMLLPTLLVGFLVAGIVEWIFHPCNPFTFAVFMAMSPLFFKMSYEKKELE